MIENENIFSFLGIFFIFIGIIFLVIPMIANILPSKDFLERIPWIILYVYRQDNFVFATSPILILLSTVYFLYYLFK
jgi:hypothetical protein